MRCSRCARGEVKGSKVSIDKRGVEGTQLSVNGPRRKAVAQVAYTWVDAGTEEGRALIRGEGTGGGRVSKRLGIEEEAIQDRDEAKGRVHYILGKKKRPQRRGSLWVCREHDGRHGGQRCRPHGACGRHAQQDRLWSHPLGPGPHPLVPRQQNRG